MVYGLLTQHRGHVTVIFPAEYQAWFDKLAAAQAHQAGGTSFASW